MTESPSQSNPANSSLEVFPEKGGPPVPSLGYYFARIGAQVFDLFLCMGFYFLIGLAIARRVGGLTPQGFNVTGLPALQVMGGTVLAAFLYFWFFEAVFSRTLGKMSLGLKVVRQENRGAGIWASFLRNLLRIVDVLPVFYVFGLIAILKTAHQQRVGDLVAKTYVVGGGSKKIKATGFFLLLVAMALLVWGGIQIRSSADLSALSIKGSHFTKGPTGKTVGSTFEPGKEAFLQFRLGPVASNKQGHVDTQVNFVVKDSQGRPLLEPVLLELKEPFPGGGNGRGELPINFKLRLPAYVEGGDYIIEVVAIDRLGKQEIQDKIPFQVKGPKIPKGASLGVQDYRFRGEEGVKAEPDYRPGETVYSKFNVLGFKLGEKNDVKLRLSLLVLDQKGQILLDRPNLLSIAEGFFYPPSYFPVNTRVNLAPGASAGNYTLNYSLHDEVAGTQMKFEKEFRVVGP